MWHFRLNLTTVGILCLTKQKKASSALIGKLKYNQCQSVSQSKLLPTNNFKLTSSNNHTKLTLQYDGILATAGCLPKVATYTWSARPLDKIVCGPSEFISWPSLNQVILGVGFPSTLQSSWAVLFTRTMTSSGMSLTEPVMLGGTNTVKTDTMRRFK